MKRTLTKIFKPNAKSLTLNEIKEALGYKNITNIEKRQIVNKLLKLELDGKIYYDFVNNCYYAFPSDFFVSKVKKIDNDVITFGVNGNLEEMKVNNENIKKKDYIIVRKTKDGFKLVKVIGKDKDYEDEKDLEKIYNLFNPCSSIHTFKDLLRITKANEEELKKVLHELENEGIIFYDAEEDVFKTMPSNYFVTTAEVSKRGFYKVYFNGLPYTLSLETTKGILPFDKVILKKDKKDISLVKIIKRANPEIVCEVLENNQIKMVGNNNIKIRCLSEEFKKLHLPIGTRFLGTISNEGFNNTYEVKFIEVLGHKNDLNAELEAIAINNGFKVRYTDEEIKEAYRIPTEVTDEDKVNRVDLTNENIFTIDGAHTKDMDDAVSIKKLANGNYELLVSIAAVSHYIKYNGPLFMRASHNTTSLYLIESVNHMLHPEVSNGICSLNPNVERLAKSYKIEIDNHGQIVDFSFFDSVIKSRKKMTYEDCNKLFEENIILEGYEEFTSDLYLMQELAQIIDNRRKANGALDFDSNEIEFILSEDGQIIDVSHQNKGPAQKIIENFMVVTNEAIAEYMYHLGLEFVYRNHEIPFDNKVKETVKLITSLGYKINNISNSDDPHVIQSIINSLNSKEEFFILSAILLRSMPKAYFSTENKGHYGLALSAYSQTTSPIRRLLDLMIEYILDNLDKIYDGSINMSELKITLNSLCQRASMMERCADKAEYEANKLYMIDYVSKHKDLEYTGFIQEITPNYMVVKTKELIEGIVYFDDILDGTYAYNPNCKWLENPRTRHKITIGSKISLQFKEANREFRILKFYANVNNLTLTRKKDYH